MPVAAEHSDEEEEVPCEAELHELGGEELADDAVLAILIEAQNRLVALRECRELNIKTLCMRNSN